MKEVNRSVIVVRAKKPFLQWLNSLPDPGKFTLDEVNQDSTTFLLPEYEDDSEIKKLLERYYSFIFEEQLDGWWRDQDAWPSKRNLKTFKEWFDVDFYCTVFDLVEKPLMKFD